MAPLAPSSNMRAACDGAGGALTRALRGALHGLLDLFYPPHCYHCGVPLRGGPDRVLCPDCLQALDRARIEPPLCPVCGAPYRGSVRAETACVRCRALPPHFDTARALFPYSGPAATLVRAFKFEGDYFLGRWLLREALKLSPLPDGLGGFDCVVPVPLHPRRARERGYNQAALLAGTLARQSRVPLRDGALRRVRYTDQQASLSALKRWKNVRGAFAAGPSAVDGERVLLVDDVMTTGATANECARVLKGAGRGGLQGERAHARARMPLSRPPPPGIVGADVTGGRGHG